MLIKIQTVEEWVKKHDPALCCLQETHFKYNDTGKLKAEGWKKMYGVNINQRKAGVAKLRSGKVGFKAKKITRGWEGHYIMMLRSTKKTGGFPGGAVVKNLPTNAGDTGDLSSIPGLGRSPGEGNGSPVQYSWATAHGVTKSRACLSDWTRTARKTQNPKFGRSEQQRYTIGETKTLE